jgi:hypothetical protein
VTRSRLVISIAAASFVCAVVAIASAMITIELARPSEHELQRAAAAEIGIPSGLLDAPGVQALADELTSRVAHRVIQESQPSVAIAVAVGTLAGAIAAVASAIVLARHWMEPR